MCDIAPATRDTAAPLESVYDDLYNDWLPHRFWPDMPGLLRWGTAGTATLWWLAQDQPDQWPTVVIRDTEQTVERIDITATELLLGLIKGPSPTRLVSSLVPPGVTFSRSPTRAGNDYD